MKKTQLPTVDIKILVVALLFWLSAEMGFYLSFGHRALLPFWPPAGFALALVILFGRKVWPGIAIGSLIIAVKNFWFDAIESSQVLMAITAVITIGSVVEPLVGEFLFRKLVKRSHPFSSALHAFYFVFIALSIPIVTAGSASIILFLTNVIEPSNFFNTLFMLWVRNTVGILLFTPLLLSIPHFTIRQVNMRQAGEGAAFILSVLAIFFMFNALELKDVFVFALPFVVIPFLLWLAFRFDIIIAAIGIIIVSVVSIYYTSINEGPFHIASSVLDSMLLLQVYVVVISVSTLVLASAVEERHKAQADLKKFNENLEAMVNERTKALEEEIQSRKQVQQKVQLTNEELVKRNTELDNFVYSVSHDLRAPIASILGLINLAKNDKGQNVKQMYLEMMEKSARQQDYFIREILDQSRNSRLEVKREPVLFNDLIEETFEQLDYSSLDGKKVEKIISVEQEEPFYTDKWRLKVVLNNIISNAIRYKNGRDPVIKVSVKVEQDKAKIIVEDNGKGIDKKHIPNLGKMFYRATDEGAGSGLGLYIVRETMQKLNGTIVIESEEGQGTTVNVEVPQLKT